MDNRRNYYRILHVQPDAPTEIIRMSYLTLMQRLKMHPDLGGDHERATLINEAFSTLIDHERRAAYDRTLARDRTLPGYRATRTGVDAGRPDGGRLDPHACSFCGFAFAPGEDARSEALCGYCGSPLCLASRHAHEAATRRAIDRASRRLPVTFYLSWPQHPGLSAITEDLSVSGMRLLTALDLVPNERLKLDCEFCAAVAVVRHARLVTDQPLWSVGIEFLTLQIKPSRGLLVSSLA